jgi:hypothetical protein
VLFLPSHNHGYEIKALGARIGLISHLSLRAGNLKLDIFSNPGYGCILCYSSADVVGSDLAASRKHRHDIV